MALRMTTIAMSLALVTCSAPPSVLEQIIESGTLTFVTRQSPTTYYPSMDEPRGIEYELAKGFAERLGVELDIYVADQFWQIFPDLMLRRADIAAAGLTVTEPRKEIVDFSPPYQNASQHVIYRRGTRRPYRIEDLYGSDIEVLAGSAYVGTLEEAKREASRPRMDGERRRRHRGARPSSRSRRASLHPRRFEYVRAPAARPS